MGNIAGIEEYADKPTGWHHGQGHWGFSLVGTMTQLGFIIQDPLSLSPAADRQVYW
jgi:hypothetical protein